MKKEITDEQIIQWIEDGDIQALNAWSENDSIKHNRVEEIRAVLTAIKRTTKQQVPHHIQENIREAIFSEQRRQKRIRAILQVAASITILLLGYGMGKATTNTNPSELSALKEEVNHLKELTLTGALQHYSASERIQLVNEIDERNKSEDSPLIAALISTFNADESPNVRYAALQALKNYVGNENVRAQLVKSLDVQSDPLIQIALIAILVEVDEKSAVAPLQDILNQQEIVPELKQQVEFALQVLI